MKQTPNQIKNLAKICLIAGGLIWNSASQAAPLINLQFNEGQGMTTADTVSGLTGLLGAYHDPLVDYVELTSNFSPSGAPNDKSITTSGKGFLATFDTNSVLAVTNGPITIESWVYVPDVGGANVGIVGYGSSYKMGLRTGAHVFTLFGLKDITNNAIPFVPPNTWVHLAAAWEPGVGVHFYYNGVGGPGSFTEYTNSLTARTPLTNMLSIASEGPGNNWVGSLDRVRIHHGLLDASQLDSEAATPKAPIPGVTLIAYNFDEAAFPSTNAIPPELPTVQSYTLFSTNSTLWTNDTPTGLAGDHALTFPADELAKPQVAVEGPLDLSVNNTNYTLQVWVKLPTTPFEDRRVIYRTLGLAPRVAVSLHPDRTLHTTVFGAADFVSTVRVPNDNRWHHIAIVSQDFNQLHLYLDGIFRQTINRTQAGAPNVGGVSGVYVGGESNYRFFEGALDRVVINNDALDAASLDYPAIPGLATFPTLESHPADLSVEAGGNAVFTATPTSPTAATYQWFYRTNLTEPGVAVAGQTTTTLNLNNITEANLGFYSLQVSNAVGVSESYSAKLNFPLDPSPTRPLDFEAFDYTSMPLTGQDGWTATDNGLRTTFIATADEITTFLTDRGLPAGEPTASGSQALIFTGAGQTAAAANFFRTFSGLESESKVTLDFSVRPLASFFQNNTTAGLGNVFLRVQTAGGVNAAGFRVGANFSIDYGLVNNNWIPTGLTADTNTFTRITMELDYTAKTYDFFVDGAKINVDPIPFYQTGTPVDHTSTTFQRLNIFKGANQAGWIMDDLSVQIPSDGPTLNIQKTESGLIISWPSSFADYVLESSTDVLFTAPQTVLHSTVGDENQATVSGASAQTFYRLKKSE